jgi:hypothetical protein
MKIYFANTLAQLYIIPSIKVTHKRYLNGDYEIIFGWFNQLLVISF